MDTFVVRVRTSHEGDPGFRGVVDEVTSGLRLAFHNPEELLMILTGRRSEGAIQHNAPTVWAAVPARVSGGGPALGREDRQGPTGSSGDPGGDPGETRL
jgi:hypothetical protein